MKRVFGDRKKIALGRSDFRAYVLNGWLYVDKTSFIEHVLEESPNVLLFARPEKTGKSMNLDMLRTFLDGKQDSRALFSGLHIKGRTAYVQINSRPVIYMDFGKLNHATYEDRFREMLMENAYNYLKDSQVSTFLHQCLIGRSPTTTGALYALIQDIREGLGARPYVLIDDYDKLLMDNYGDAEYEAMREWLTNVLESALKDNRHLEKGILMGETRLAQESLLSGLNKLVAYDVFKPSVFDGDFSLTEEEAFALLGEKHIDAARGWYGNCRMGGLKLFSMHSVLSYMKNGKLENYRGKSGSMEMLIVALNAARVDALTDLISRGKAIEATMERRLLLKRLWGGEVLDSSYYSLAVQSGLLTYDSADDGKNFRLSLPNREVRDAWKVALLKEVVQEKHKNLREIFKNIADMEGFSQSFQEFVSAELSNYNIGKEIERTYYVLLFGLILGAGFKGNVNRVRSYGRFGLWLEGQGYNVIIEFKKARKQTDILEEMTDFVLAKIDRKEYYATFPETKIGRAHV